VNWKKIIKTIKSHKRFLISTHVNPDPDAICSELALGMYLKSLGKKVTIINHEVPPKRLQIFPGIRLIKGYRKGQNSDYDVGIVLDCGELERVGDVVNLFNDRQPLINIDHHVTNEGFGDINMVLPKASSTAEIIYELLKKANCSITKQMALNLYAGILTDTGSFRFENTSVRTHQIAGELLKFGFSVPVLYQKLYEMIPLGDIQAFTNIINQFRSLRKGQILYIELKKNIMSKFSDAFDLKDTIFKFLRSIEGVAVIIIFTEISKNETRVNFRSTDRVDVARLARSFKGGGHPRASGCMIEKNIQHSKKAILAKLKEFV